MAVQLLFLTRRDNTGTTATLNAGVGQVVNTADAPIVYVVDDDDSVREALKSLIRSADLSVETFASAQEFFAFRRPDVPGCLVLDVNLPARRSVVTVGQMAS